jgi:hypothetical protein
MSRTIEAEAAEHAALRDGQVEDATASLNAVNRLACRCCKIFGVGHLSVSRAVFHGCVNEFVSERIGWNLAVENPASFFWPYSCSSRS